MPFAYHRRYPEIILLFLILLIPGCITTEYNVASHSEDLFFYSTEKEVAMGQNLSRQISRTYKLSQDSLTLEKLDRIGARLAEVCDRRELSYYFQLLEEEEKNAFCIPGGYVYMFRGLLEELENEDQIAFVLAHEIGHIVARHHIKKLQAAMGYNLAVLATLPANKSPDFYQGLSLAVAQIMAAYSREDEHTADELAVKYMEKAGFYPAAGIEVLEKLYDLHKKEPLRPLSYFRTHPYVPQRIKRIKQSLGMEIGISDYINE